MPTEEQTYNINNIGPVIGRVLALTDHILKHPRIHGTKLPQLVFDDVEKLIYWHTQALKKVSMALPEITPEGDELMELSEKLLQVNDWHHHNPLNPKSNMYASYYKTCEEISRRAIRLPIGKAIVAERMRQSITQTELAKKSELSNNHVRRIEQGKYNYTIDNLAKVADALDLEVKLVKKEKTEDPQ